MYLNSGVPVSIPILDQFHLRSHADPLRKTGGPVSLQKGPDLQER